MEIRSTEHQDVIIQHPERAMVDAKSFSVVRTNDLLTRLI